MTSPTGASMTRYLALADELGNVSLELLREYAQMQRSGEQRSVASPRFPDSIQGATEHLGRLKAFLTVFFKRAEKGFVKIFRQAGNDVARAARYLTYVGLHQRKRLIALKDFRAGDHLEQEGAQRVDVGAEIDGRISLHLFWRSVVERADDGAGLSEPHVGF